MNNRILIVDDEEAILFSLRTYFGRLGFEVECARDLVTAANLLLQREHGLLIADVRLTGADGREGLELVSFARNLSRAPRIIVLTAYGNSETLQEAISRGADSVLLKPEPLAEIAQLAKILLANPRPSESRNSSLDWRQYPNGEAPNQKKVLLVDDSNTALLMQRLVLRDRTPYNVMVATDGLQAVERARAEVPDLIIMDAVMPRMTGVEACRELRNCPQTRNIPIVLVATRSEKHSLRSELTAGCNDCVIKPIDPDTLVELLDTYLA
jgi:CheY-like chemotaxis protein